MPETQTSSSPSSTLSPPSMLKPSPEPAVTKETGATAVDSKATTADSKATAADSKVATADSKAATADSKAATTDKKANLDEAAPPAVFGQLASIPSIPISLSTPSLISSLLLLAIAALFIYITFRIVQTLWHLRVIRNSLQESKIKEVNEFLNKEQLASSVNECCDGGFLWLPLLGAGFNFLSSLFFGAAAIYSVVNAARSQ